MKKLLVGIILALGSQTGAYAQFYSVRTNVSGLLTGNLNLEYGMTLNKKWSMHIPIQYNPFIYSSTKNTKFQNLTIMPGVRWWTEESYRKHFIGLYGVASHYNVGNIWNDNRYDGDGFGAGLSVGCAYPISPRFNFEWEAGLAALWCSYDKFVARKNGYLIGHYTKWHLVPSKVAFNVTYLF